MKSFSKFGNFCFRMLKKYFLGTSASSNIVWHYIVLPVTIHNEDICYWDVLLCYLFSLSYTSFPRIISPRSLLILRIKGGEYFTLWVIINNAVVGIFMSKIHYYSYRCHVPIYWRDQSNSSIFIQVDIVFRHTLFNHFKYFHRCLLICILRLLI